MGPSAHAVLLTSSSGWGSGSPCSSGSPSPSATGWTLIRYSSIRPWEASERAKLTPPKTTMSLPGSALSSGISSSTGRSVTRVLLHSTSVSVLENTTFGSVFMSSPVGLFELGHACAMS